MAVVPQPKPFMLFVSTKPGASQCPVDGCAKVKYAGVYVLRGTSVEPAAVFDAGAVAVSTAEGLRSVNPAEQTTSPRRSFLAVGHLGVCAVAEDFRVRCFQANKRMEGGGLRNDRLVLSVASGILEFVHVSHCSLGLRDQEKAQCVC